MPELKGIGPYDVGRFSTDEDGNLYWDGKRIIMSTAPAIVPPSYRG